MAVAAMLIVSLVGLGVTLSGALAGIAAVPALPIYAFVGFGALLMVSTGMLFLGTTSSVGRAGRQAGAADDQDADSADFGDRTPQRAASTSGTLLAVDDDPFVLDLVKLIAEHSGYSKVTVVGSAYEALQLIESPIRFDGFLLDISMPGMNGIELCRLIRAREDYRQTPVLMLTAMRDLQHIADAYKAGASDYASKPFEVGELEKRLREMQTAQRAWKIDAAAAEPAPRPARPPVRPVQPEAKVELTSETCDVVTLQAYKNFLTQLPNGRLDQVQVLALWGDWREHPVQAPKAAPSSMISEEELLKAAVTSFDGVQTLVTATEGGALLVAQVRTDEIRPGHIERDFERALRHVGKAGRGGVIHVPIVSVGRPVWPSGQKPERADQTIARAMANADSRRAVRISPSRKATPLLRKLS